MKIKVICIQTTSSKFPEKNIKMLDKIFKKIKSTKVNLICLPECVAIFSDDKKRINVAKKGRRKYFDLFECQKVANYIISKSFNREISKKLKWMD